MIKASRFCRLGLIAAITLFFCPNLEAGLGVSSYAIYEEFGAPLYVVKLESEQKLGTSENLFADDGPKRLSLKVLSDSVVQRQWCRFWTQNIAINISSEKLERMADTILRVCDQLDGELIQGDQIDFFRLSSTNTKLSLNGVDIDTLQGEGVFEAFLTPFFGNSPVNTEVKAKLLSHTNNDSEAATAYEETAYSSARIAAVESWIAPPEPEPLPEIDLEEENLVAEVKGKRPKSDARIAESGLHSLETLESEKNKQDSQVSWSPVWGTDPVNLYKTDGLVQEPVLASAVYQPNTTMFASTSDFDTNPLSPKDEQPRISLLDIQEYQQQSLRQVYAFIEYPSIAQRRGREGALRLEVDIDAQGNIQEIRTLESSRHNELNEAAITAIEEAAPFDSPPLANDEETFKLLLPIRFTLQ